MSEQKYLRQLNTVGNAFKFKFYLNSMHAVLFNDKTSPIHKHTWEISLNLREKMSEFNEFNKIEKTINDYLNAYNDKVINDVAPFDRLNPTMENMGVVFFEEINDLIKNSNYILESVEISENPTRTYIVEKIMNYKKLESDIHKSKMEAMLNEMRGIKNVMKKTEAESSSPKMSEELGKAMSRFSRDFEELNARQDLRRKVAKKKMIFRMVLLVFLVAVGITTYILVR